MPDANDPNAYQVGGDHYRGMGIQPWDLITALGLDYLTGNALKYLSRDKGQRSLDNAKALHYLQKRRESMTHPMPHRVWRSPLSDREDRQAALAAYIPTLPVPYGACVALAVALPPHTAAAAIEDLLARCNEEDLLADEHVAQLTREWEEAEKPDEEALFPAWAFIARGMRWTDERVEEYQRKRGFRTLPVLGGYVPKYWWYTG